MASTGHQYEQARQAQDTRLVIDAIPTLAWSVRADGSADFFNQRWLDYPGLSAEQARDWGWTAALHSDDLNRVVDYWRSVLASGEMGEIEGRLRRFDGVYRWFLFRATPSFDNDGKIAKWFGTNTDIEDRKRAESLLAGENLVLEMTAKGNSLQSILEALCRVVEQTASGCFCSVVLIDAIGSKVQQAVAPSLPSSYNDRFPGIAVDREGHGRGSASDDRNQVCPPDQITFLSPHESSIQMRRAIKLPYAKAATASPACPIQTLLAILLCARTPHRCSGHLTSGLTKQSRQTPALELPTCSPVPHSEAIPIRMTRRVPLLLWARTG